MTKAEFISELNEILQRDVLLNDDDLLENIEEWDSMSVLGVMSMFDMEFGVTLTIEQIRAATTVGDIVNMASQNIST